jgi:hypothetical protein
LVQAYYAGTLGESERRSFLEDQRIDYVYYGPRESQLSQMEEPPGDDLLLIYADGEYALYQIMEKR